MINPTRSQVNLSGKRALVAGERDFIAESVIRRLVTAGASSGADEQIVPCEPVALSTRIAALGGVHIVVINPGWTAYKPFMDTTPAEWDDALNRNFEAATFAAQAAARHMVAQEQGGRIIFISSVAALKPLAYMSAAGASLAALHAMARMAAVDLGPHRITVNVVAVGWSDREMGLIDPGSSMADRLEDLRKAIPAGRAITTGDIGDVCCFLASDVAEYLTGAIIPVDGGYLLTQADGEAPRPRRGS